MAFKRDSRGEPIFPEDSRYNEVDRAIAAAARADSNGGLKMITHHDESNRPHRTFELQPGATKRGTWMAPYCGEIYQQLRICQKPPTMAQAAAFEASWRDAQKQIASGHITLPSLDI
ncbi:hypothetical protein [Paraburkholderia bryophila]|uniref:Uncharacterized protein n=1 Tax=Paraburkholderia bryophila TaxID=420952 RepID=A0A7Y9W4G1_9BURK|nr:hypothetical protein [Paraburkholderia bryophila]NYH13560.1 hypothetical protein [Paraburkholderia bryophila]